MSMQEILTGGPTGPGGPLSPYRQTQRWGRELDFCHTAQINKDRKHHHIQQIKRVFKPISQKGCYTYLKTCEPL